MTRNNIIIALCIVLIAIATGCRSNSFKIDAQLQGLGTQNIKIVYFSSGAVVEQTVAVQDNHFSFSGSAPQLTIANVVDAQGGVIAQLVVQNGDKVTIKGNVAQPLNIQITGSDINEQWMEFKRQYKDYFGPVQTRNSELDAEIEKYINSHPSNLLSTVLLVAHYNNLSDDEKVKSLLDKIDNDAKPESLTAVLNQLPPLPKPVERLTSLLLYDSHGSFSQFNARDAQCSVLLIWSRDDYSRKTNIDTLISLKRIANSNQRLQIADILIDADSASWNHITNTDSTRWKHYWAPEGPLNHDLKALGVGITPMYIVGDSTGKIVYRGSDPAMAHNKTLPLIRN